ncbi:MAG: VOC family protein [Anaerolineae bacterium]|nr:VOC family protein [Anaerolineae bacterium]
MLQGIDHLVVVVPDLDTAIANYTALGFTVVPGGRHPIGSHNALIAFEDGAYIELLAFYAPNPGHRWYAALQHGGGLTDYCLVTNELRAEIANFRARGLKVSDPTPLSRTRPDGYQLEWLMGLSDPVNQPGTPFLIEDLTPRDERIPKQTQHANGVTGIQSVTVFGSDTVLGALTTLLGSAESIDRPDLHTSGYRSVNGAHTFDLLQLPADDQVRGGVYSAVLTTRGQQRGALDLDRALNGRFSLAG